MKMYKGLLLAAFAAGAACTAMAQDNQTPPTMAMTDHIGVSDQIFLMNVIHGNAMEIELGRLGSHKATTKEVADFAGWMLIDHGKAQDQLVSTYGSNNWFKDWQLTLKDTSARNNIGYPYGTRETWMSDTTKTADPNMTAPWMYLDASDWDVLHHLDNLTGMAFDKAFMQTQVELHAKTLMKFNEVAALSTNSDVKSWESGNIGMIQAHLDRARAIVFDLADPINVSRSSPWMH